jgi:membrane protease YdiL (CAAX protease family)
LQGSYRDSIIAVVAQPVRDGDPELGEGEDSVDDAPVPGTAEAEPPRRLSRKRRRRLVLEVLAVLSIACFPLTIGAGESLIRFGAHAPSHTEWDLFYHIREAPFTVIALLYIMHRSREPWAYFGLARFRLRDVAVWIALLVVTFVWMRLWRVILSLDAPDIYPLRPSHPTWLALLLLIPAMLANALSEELAMRGYLIPRLQALFGRKTSAVIFSSLAFASYHIYQGPDGFVGVFMFGLLYGSVFVLTRRLWPLVLAHAAWDIFFVVGHWIHAATLGHRL